MSRKLTIWQSDEKLTISIFRKIHIQNVYTQMKNITSIAKSVHYETAIQFTTPLEVSLVTTALRSTDNIGTSYAASVGALETLL
jgi:hypothetical protein